MWPIAPYAGASSRRLSREPPDRTVDQNHRTSDYLSDWLALQNSGKMRKLKVVELYAGTARSVEPFRSWRRADVSLLVDANTFARDTYLANYPEAPYAKRDIAALRPSQLLSLAGGRDQARARKLTDDASAQDLFWADFQFERDPFLKLLENAWYAGFFLGAVPRLDQKQALPRIEVLVSSSTEESGPFNEGVLKKCNTLIESLKLSGFEVSADHAMFGAKGWIDVVPRLLVEVHQTVKIWAAELQSRVQEYIGYHLSRYIKGGGHRGVRIRPWRRAELEAWAVQMRDERRRQAGADPHGGQIE
jgi:hypothetical protein